MARLKRDAYLAAKKLKGFVTPINISRSSLHKDVPYFSQWETPNLVQAIIEKKISATDDPLWKNSGAKTKEEYVDWSWNGCGMACLKMILAYQGSKPDPLVILGKKCTEYGGYRSPLSQSQGMLYRPFVKFVKAEYGIEAIASSAITLKDILVSLAHKNIVIASVSPQIREPKTKPKQKGGHLVLVLGYDLDAKKLYVHNPSGFSKQTQEYAAISFHDFKKFFANRGVIVQTKIHG